MRALCFGLIALLISCNSNEAPPSTPKPSASVAPPVVTPTTVTTATPEADAAPPPVVAKDSAPPTKPHVRVTRWICDSDDGCNGWPTLAYDALPAVTTDGSQVAVVERFSRFGHESDKERIRIVDTKDTTKSTLIPLERGTRDIYSAAALEKRKADLEDLFAKANAALDEKTWSPLAVSQDDSAMPTVERPKAKGTWDAWKDSDGDCKTCRFKDTWSAGGVTVSIIAAQVTPSGASPEKLESVAITVDETKQVTTADISSWKPKKGCVPRALRVIGARRNPNIVVLQEGPAMARHDCDGKLEPKVVRVVRF